ncbi:MAG TPA: vitamin K epoxide reductase family protein [Solirubrobacteraceae bacterium]|jgi:uncharacterized membrane protein|nr:vitamin K epoxide reductase family protein [Solirubrobacteraceae bacterium]
MSARTLRRTLVGLTLLGLGVASYLTYIHYAGIKPLCGRNGGGCEIVQTSEYSKLAGVPVALIGLIGYVAILASLLAPESENSRLATVGLAVVGFGFSAYLTYREIYSIHNICEYCISSFVIVWLIMCLAIWRFLRGDAPRPAPLAHAEAPAPGHAAGVGAAGS